MKKEIKIEATIIWDSDESGTIKAGNKNRITGKATYDLDSVKENERQAFESYLEYLVLHVTELVGESGIYGFTLENSVKVNPERSFCFHDVPLRLEMDISDDDIGIKKEVLGKIKQGFALYQLNRNLPDGILSYCALALSQSW